MLAKIAMWRTKRALARTLEVASRGSLVTPQGDLAAWLARATSIAGLWDSCTCPQWAIHLAHQVGVPLQTIMTACTQTFSKSIEVWMDDLPKVEPYWEQEDEQPRALDTYIAGWAALSEEELIAGMACFEREAEVWLDKQAAEQALAQVQACPFRRRPDQSDPAYAHARGLVVLASFHWFAAAIHATSLSPRKDAMCEALVQALALTHAVNPSGGAAQVDSLVAALR